MEEAQHTGREKAREGFAQRFGSRPDLEGVAPGRVNLIGEHTDYNDGFVFPAAIDREVWICARVTKGRSQVCSLERGDAAEFDASTTSPGDVGEWGAYPAGIAWALREKTSRSLPNIQAVVHGEVPIGSGISSSAAIELAFAVVWNQLADLSLENKELAKVGQRCENKYVGVNSGIMDQMASAMGKEGHALFLDTRSLNIEYAPIPEDLTIVLCDTGKPRALTDSAYNERRTQCERAAEALRVKSLRDATLPALDSAKSNMDELIYRRAKHVLTENARCLAFVTALDQGDKQKIGELMRGSHESLRDDYEVSSPELDAMAEAAWAADGCVGARMTGAGFGGACVALVEAAKVADFVTETAMTYKRRTDRGGNFIACRAASGARIFH
jgi:galactokinase